MILQSVFSERGAGGYTDHADIRLEAPWEHCSITASERPANRYGWLRYRP